jgi:hypothetical protein
MSTNVRRPELRRPLLAVAAVSVGLLVAGVAATSSAWAGSAPPSTTTLPAASGSAPASGPASAGRVAVAKARVDVSVDRRVATIDRVSARISSDTNLTAAEKATLTGDLGTRRADLGSLKAKVDGESTVAAIKADVKAARSAGKGDQSAELATLYLRGADASAYLDAVDRRVGTLQSRLDKAKAAGKDVTAAQNAVADLQAKVTDARAHLKGFGQALLSAQPASAGFPAAKATLKAVHTDVTFIRKDAGVIRGALR